MDKELQIALAGLIDGAIAAKDFVIAELPDVVQQILHYYLFKSCFVSVIGIVMLILVAIYWRRSISACEAESDHCQLCSGYRDFVIPVVIIIIVSTVIGFCMVVSAVPEVAKIILAPKLFIIEYASWVVSK